MGYDIGRLRSVFLFYENGYEARGAGRLSFAEYLQRQVGHLHGEGRSWAERRARLGEPIPNTGFQPLRTRLVDLTDGGTLTPTDAAIVWRWNVMIEALVNNSSAQVPGAAPTATRASAVLDYLLQGLGKNFSETNYRAFRHRMRDLIVDDIVYLRGGADLSKSPGTHDGTPLRAWGEQLTRLETWEGRVPRGDSGTIGALWTAYAQARFKMGLPAESTVAGIDVIAGRNLRLPDGRMGDAALKFGRPTTANAPSKGEWAADYKGGNDPHDIAQSTNYSGNMDANGGKFTMGGHTYNGLLLVFQSMEGARNARRAINAANSNAGLHPNLKVGYFDSGGGIVWLR
jgi:hypothetical protein